MSQHDFDIANATASNARVDINLALKALGSLSSGATEPATRYANMLWYDTATNLIKFRSEANDAWISIGYFDQSANAFRILDDTQVTNTSGTQTGLLGDQTTATWEAGTGTTDSLVSPAKVKASVIANAPVNAIGVGQTWQNVSGSRTTNTVYTNTTARPIMVIISADGSGNVPIYIHPSGGGSEFVIDSIPSDRSSVSFIIPASDGYEIRGTISVSQWSELK